MKDASAALDLPLLECARLIRSGAVSPVALAEAALQRAAGRGKELNCFVTVTPEVAREEARRAEREVRSGQHLGPLHGIPYGLKDNIDTAGIRTTWGARPYADRVPERDATVVERLRRAGAVLVGKLSMTEMAGGFAPRWPHASINGACRNPWDPSRSAGGSSSGPAAAVAARLLGFALGTETMGSLMNPAAYCGVTALRPTYGLVPKAGVLPFAHTLDKVGTFCRTATDCAAVLDALAGEDPRDPTSVPRPKDLGHAVPGRGAGLRAAVLELPTSFPIPAAIPVFYREALEVLRQGGLRLERAALPPLPWREVADVVMVAEAEVAFDDLLRSGRADQLVDFRGPPDLGGRPSDYVRAMAIRTEMQRQLRAFFARYDLIVSANNPVVPAPLDQPIPGFGADALRAAGNLAGLPSVAVPMGFLTGPKLPVGLAITGPPGGDSAVLDAAALYQSRTAWHLEHPPAEGN